MLYTEPRNLDRMEVEASSLWSHLRAAAEVNCRGPHFPSTQQYILTFSAQKLNKLMHRTPRKIYPGLNY